MPAYTEQPRPPTRRRSGHRPETDVPIGDGRDYRSRSVAASKQMLDADEDLAYPRASGVKNLLGTVGAIAVIKTLPKDLRPMLLNSRSGLSLKPSLDMPNIDVCRH